MNDLNDNINNHPTLDETDTSKDASLTSLYSAPLFINETDLTKTEFKAKKFPIFLISSIIIDIVLMAVGIALIILATKASNALQDILIIFGSILIIIGLAIAIIFSINQYRREDKKIIFDKRKVNFYEESLVSESFSKNKLISTYTIPYVDITSIIFDKTKMIITHGNKKSFTVDINGFKEKSDYKKVFDLIYTYKK